MQEKKCENCEHWHYKKGFFEDVQECRRFPPRIRFFPHSEWNNWCGEFKQKTEESEEKK